MNAPITAPITAPKYVLEEFVMSVQSFEISGMHPQIDINRFSIITDSIFSCGIFVSIEKRQSRLPVVPRNQVKLQS
jgi:hypothetical protein